MNASISKRHPKAHGCSANQSEGLNVRQSWAGLPQWIQPFLTWLSGKPLNDEKPWRVGPWHHLIAAILPLVAGVTLAAYAMQFGILLPLLSVGWLFAVHGMRKLRTGILHQCSHHNFLRNRRVDTTLGTLVSVFLCSESYRSYQVSHVGDHHSRQGHMTMADPTVQFLIFKLGLRGGMARQECWRKLLRALLSPRFYLEAIWGRISSHFIGTTWSYRISVIACQTGFTWALIQMLGIQGWLIAWCFPLWILFSISAALRLSCRHTFPVKGRIYSGREAVTAFTDGIFVGEPAPTRGGLLPWVKWWSRLALVHFPQRLFVLPLDGPTHDLHHRSPRHRHWPIYPFLRRDDLLAGHAGWPPYTETWGAFRMIDRVYGTLEKADPTVYCPQAGVVPVHPVELSAALND